eukprot:TRINITY_DN6131_c0_g1_i3.p1 TRINITY_DN6131_c0_g1~~TRINITY_DN6131_c0_g1_i3.p1  ORF type:complete len:359 (+),score=74.50 TRINITY_DN6131_c0_g1_i3:67-1143(+)
MPPQSSPTAKLAGTMALRHSNSLGAIRPGSGGGLSAAGSREGSKHSVRRTSRGSVASMMLSKLNTSSSTGSLRPSTTPTSAGGDSRWESEDSSIEGSPASQLVKDMINSRIGTKESVASRKGSKRPPDDGKIHLPLGQLSQMAFGLKRLSKQLNLPFDETHRAVKIFVEYTGSLEGEDAAAAKMFRIQFKNCLQYVMQVRGQKEDVNQKITDRCFATCDRDNSGYIDVEEFCIWYTSESFSKEMVLDEKTHQLRNFAEEHGIAIPDLDRYQSYFNKFDCDGSGEIDYEEFCQLVTMLWKIPKNLEIPESRLRNFWKTADLDGGGSLDFQEFVLWYRKYCENPNGEDPITGFYRSIRNV